MSQAIRTLLMLALAAGALAPVPAGAVANRPTIPDSLSVDGLSAELDQPLPGVATAYMIGTTLLEGGDAAGALPYLSHAYRMNPAQDEFALACRDALTALGYLRDALDISRGLISRNPGDYRIYMEHLSLAVALENYDEALEDLADCRIQHPDSLQLGLMEAEILVRAGRWDDAHVAFREILPRMPEEREHIYLALAEMAVMRGHQDKAAALWDEGLEALPDSRPLRLGAIQHRIALARDEEALRLADAGDALAAHDGAEPQTPWLRTAAAMLATEGHDSTAVAYLVASFSRDALDLETSLLLTRLQAGREDWAGAIPVAEEIVRRWPDSARARLYLGEFKAAGGDPFAGAAMIRRAIEMDPEDPDALLALISIHSQRLPDLFEHAARYPDDDPTKREVLDAAARAQTLLDAESPADSHMMVGATFQAMGAFESSLLSYEMAARDTDLAREADLNRSLALDALGRRDEALALLEELIEAYPLDPVVQNALGYTLTDLDRDLDRAERLIRAALTQEPENPAFLDSLGWLHHRRGDPVEALDYLVKAANILPEDPEILEHLGFVLMDLERYDRALTVLKRALALGGDPADLEPAIADLEPASP